MGLQHSSRKKLVFIKTKDGKFFAGKEPEPFEELKGLLTDVGFEDVEFEKNSGKKVKVLQLKIEDDAVYKLTLPWDNISTTNLVKFLKSADLTRPITIIPSMKEEGGVKKRSIFVEQDGRAMKSFYTKANPNGLPELVKTKFKGQEKWDNGDQLDFLENVVLNEIKPSLVKLPESTEVVEEADAQEHAEKLPWE